MFPIKSASPLFSCSSGLCYVCVVTPTVSYQLLWFLSASRQVGYNEGEKPAALWAFQTGELLPHPSFLPTSLFQLNKSLPFTSDLIRPVTFALLGWTPDDSLLHLVLCCRLHLPIGIAPTRARLCPPAIHSDFVQLVNLASPPCWELWQRKREKEEEVEEGWELRNEREICNFEGFFSFSLTDEEELPHGMKGFDRPRTHVGESSHTFSVYYTVHISVCRLL